MGEPFLAQITILGSDFAPRGYAQCDGQFVAINTNQSLYSLLGTMYGGDGRTTFAFPDLRGRAPIHFGTGGVGSYTIAAKGGQEDVTLTLAEIPVHRHVLKGQDVSGNNGGPNVSRYLAKPTAPLYALSGTSVTLYSASITNTGGGQAHNNMQPFTVVNFCMATKGIFPSRS